MVGAGRFELPTSWSQTRRPAAGPRPDSTIYLMPDNLITRLPGYLIARQFQLPEGWKGRVAGIEPAKPVVSLERVELSSLAPEASTLSVELQGPVWRLARLARIRIPRRPLL